VSIPVRSPFDDDQLFLGRCILCISLNILDHTCIHRASCGPHCASETGRFDQSWSRSQAEMEGLSHFTSTRLLTMVRTVVSNSHYVT
jgi:hypothetical protein